MSASKYSGLPGPALVRPQDDSAPWRLVMGYEEIRTFEQEEDPTRTGLVRRVAEQVNERNLANPGRSYTAQQVKDVGAEILASFDVS